MDEEEESQLKENPAEVGNAFDKGEYSNFLVDMEPSELAREDPPHEQSFPLRSAISHPLTVRLAKHSYIYISKYTEESLAMTQRLRSTTMVKMRQQWCWMLSEDSIPSACLSGPRTDTEGAITLKSLRRSV